MLTHANLMHNCESSTLPSSTRSSSGVFWLPIYHDMGLIGGILQPLYIGRPLAACRRWLSCSGRCAGCRRSASIAARSAADRTLPTICASRRSTPEQSAATRSELLVLGVQRRRAGASGNDRRLLRSLRAVRLPPRGVLSLLRLGRGDADRHRRLQERAAGGPFVRREGPGKWRHPLGACRRWRKTCGGWWAAAVDSRPEDRHRRPRDVRAMFA